MVTTNNLHIKVMHMELRDHPQPTEWHPYELAVTVSITNKGEGSASLADRHFMFDGGMGVRKAHSGLEMIEPQSKRVVTLLFATEQSMDPPVPRPQERSDGVEFVLSWASIYYDADDDVYPTRLELAVKQIRDGRSEVGG